MENVYNVKVRTKCAIGSVFPSERRYSSSTVLGFTVVFLILSGISCLLATLVLTSISVNATNRLHGNVKSNTPSAAMSVANHSLIRKVSKDVEHGCIDEYASIPATVAIGSYAMSFGTFLAVISGLFAWKQWYVDHNITWFFIGNCCATITSFTSIFLCAICFFNECFHSNLVFSSGLFVNVLIASVLSLIWSVVAGRLAFNGMKSVYPNDVTNKDHHRRNQVNTTGSNDNAIIKNMRRISSESLLNFLRKLKMASLFYNSTVALSANTNVTTSLSSSSANYNAYEMKVRDFLASQPETATNTV